MKSAIARGTEIVAKFGPMALTLRGLARELGVTASALVHFFGNRAGLRSAVAHAAAARMRPYSVVRSGGLRAASTLRRSAEQWVDFAENNPNIYRIIFGEGWRDEALSTPTRRELAHSFDRIANIGQMSGHIRNGSTREHSWLICAAIHGLASSAADGTIPRAGFGPLIERFIGAVT